MHLQSDHQNAAGAKHASQVHKSIPQLASEVRARQKCVKVRSLYLVNEQLEDIFNAARAKHSWWGMGFGMP